MSSDEDLDILSASHFRWLYSFLLSSLTLITWDLLENIPDDVRLLTLHTIRLPSVTYFLTRITTFIMLILSILDLGELGTETQGYAYAAFLALQRLTTSILLYLRVHALYRSNRWVQGFFLIVCLGLMVSCFLVDFWSALCSVVFDLGIVVAIVVHLKRQSGVSMGPKVWFPLKFRSESPITDRFLRDSLYLAVVAVVIKIPLLVHLCSNQRDPRLQWEWMTYYLDAAIMCIISTKIFRDMKLGHWRESPQLTPISLGSSLRFPSSNNTAHSTVG